MEAFERSDFVADSTLRLERARELARNEGFTVDTLRTALADHEALCRHGEGAKVVKTASR